MIADAPIFVGVPVYRGWDLVDETLRSIRDQEFRNFRVLISVDGADERSAEVCAKYAEDSRFHLVLQKERLGWARNLNWLMAQSTGEFFCYWQQDDICATSYFRVLYDHAVQHPEAACAYSDIQWFGSLAGREELPSVTGPPLQRVLTEIEKGHFAPFRGLVRQSALKAAGPLRVNEYDSRLEDLIWIAKIAREGELHRVRETLYFKRAHNANAHSNPLALPQEFRRAVWIEYGLGMLETAIPLVNESGQLRLLNTMLERLLIARPDRWLFYDPWRNGLAELVRFADDFVDAAIQRFGPDRWAGFLRLPDPRAALEILDLRQSPDRRLIGLALRDLQVRRMIDRAARAGRLEERFSEDDPGTALLDHGWSTPESWGVWSDGPAARLQLPIPCDGRAWRLTLHGYGLTDGRIIARIGPDTVEQWACTTGPSKAVGTLTITSPTDPGEIWLDLDFPDAASPLEMRLSPDPRRLGLALDRIIAEQIAGPRIQQIVYTIPQ